MALSQPFRNEVGLSKAKLDELLAGFAKLAELDAELRDRLLRYLLDDGDDSCLVELAGRSDAAQAVGLWNGLDFARLRQLPCDLSPYNMVSGSPWVKFFGTIEAVDCRVYSRLGKVFEAAATRFPVAWEGELLRSEMPVWVEILLFAGQRDGGNMWTEGHWTTVSGPLVEQMLTSDGRSTDGLVTAAFRTDLDKWTQMRVRQFVLRIPGLGKTFASHRDSIVGFLQAGTAGSRLIAVQNLLQAETPAEPFVEELVACATDSSKRLREVAECLLKSAAESARPWLEKAATDKNRMKRERSIALLSKLCGDSARTFLQSLQRTEKNEIVKKAIASALGEAASEASQPGLPSLEPPPAEPLCLNAPVTPALRECLERLFERYDKNARHKLDATCRLLADGGGLRGFLKGTLVAPMVSGEAAGAQTAFFEHPACRLIHAIRFLAMIGDIDQPGSHYQGMQWAAVVQLEVYRRSHSPKITLREVAEAFGSLDLPDEMLVTTILGGYCYGAFDWEPEAVWPFFFERLDVLEKAFDPPTSDWMSRYTKRRELENALRVLTKFPQVPPPLVGKLWDMASGPSKADRLRAQEVVVKLPDLQERLARALAARSFQPRAAAAEWMGRLGDRRAVGPLHTAARREKQDVALDAMLTALERLDESIEPYLDRKKLLVEAKKGLKKGTPPALEWFPWDRMPKVHWQQSGKQVPPQVLTWFLVQSYKLKSPEAGPLLRRYCAMMEPTERHELGQFVLTAWLDRDLDRKHTDAEARAMARQKAAQSWQAYQQVQQWHQQRGQPLPTSLLRSQQQLEDDFFAQLQRECGTAVGEKGVLAVAAACCGDAAVPPVERYLKEWYGYRAAQCKALVAMLSCIDRPAAIQYLLSVANRFRTKGIREEAEKQVQALAERKGWSLDELADRTLPTAGFDDEGKLELSFGQRRFVARVNESLAAVLYDEDGKALKSLPAPRKSDDPDQAKAAKKAFSAARSELKKFVSGQTTRLYEAMCTERTWIATDWHTYVLGHPLMKFLCQRLVWSVCDGDEVRQTFRPLDDGTLSDSDDGEVRLAPDARLRIAHACHVPPEAASAWARHLADYEISPLFAQFGREPYALPEEKRSATLLDDFVGHVVEAFKLRGTAAKLGYTRGETQDGGWFYDYVKTFPGLGIRVHLNFSGNGLPEENRTVALGSLGFQRTTAEQNLLVPFGGGMPLAEVPAVLLTECFNDLRTVAATGPGFDPEWEGKVG